MKTPSLVAVLALVLASPVRAEEGTVAIELPAEHTSLAPGPNLAAAQICMVCHSVDYIYMQPPLTDDQWRSEVLKMKNTFGAPISDADVELIVVYLLSQNGEGEVQEASPAP